MKLIAPVVLLLALAVSAAADSPAERYAAAIERKAQSEIESLQKEIKSHEDEVQKKRRDNRGESRIDRARREREAEKKIQPARDRLKKLLAGDRDIVRLKINASRLRLGEIGELSPPQTRHRAYAGNPNVSGHFKVAEILSDNAAVFGVWRIQVHVRYSQTGVIQSHHEVEVHDGYIWVEGIDTSGLTRDKRGGPGRGIFEVVGLNADIPNEGFRGMPRVRKLADSADDFVQSIED